MEVGATRVATNNGGGIPLYRQRQILARQGIQLDRATLCDWVGQACWWLRPLRNLILAHVVGHGRPGRPWPGGHPC